MALHTPSFCPQLSSAPMGPCQQESPWKGNQANCKTPRCTDAPQGGCHIGTHRLSRFTIISFVTRGTILTLGATEQVPSCLPDRTLVHPSLVQALSPHMGYMVGERALHPELNSSKRNQQEEKRYRASNREQGQWDGGQVAFSSTYCRSGLSRGARITRKTHWALKSRERDRSGL